MCNSYRTGNLLVDEIDLEAKLLRNKVAAITEDEFVKGINRIVREEERRCCKGCEVDETSQDHHDCLMREDEEYGFITMRWQRNFFLLPHQGIMAVLNDPDMIQFLTSDTSNVQVVKLLL